MTQRNILLSLAALTLCVGTSAQTAREEITRNPLLASSSYTAYYADQAPAALTPAPKGYKPFYLTHYGRHGSRQAAMKNYLDQPLYALRAAQEAGVLTAEGRRVLTIVERLNADTDGRLGDLTPKGARQHQGIAERMYRNFPEVFAKGATVDARSTNVIRCILSMANECNRLAALNPALQFRLDASNHDMYYMNGGYPELNDVRYKTQEANDAMERLRRGRVHTGRIMSVLFGDSTYVPQKVSAYILCRELVVLAGNMQSFDYGDDMQLQWLFTPEERYNFWIHQNFVWYNALGPSPLTKSAMPGMEAKLLRNIVGTADSLVQQSSPAATLRFGHEVCLFPLACLMELGECGYLSTDPDSVAEHWRDYKIFPMAGNLQVVFYRSKKAGDPVLVKALLNEREVSLPATPYKYPYYRWSDVRSHWLAAIKRTEAFVKQLQEQQKKN